VYFLGSHTSNAGGIHMAVRRAGKGGMRALQVFSAMPQFYNEKISVKPERVERFVKAVDDTGLDRRRIIVHAAYVVNTASPEPEKFGRSKAALAKELERTTALGVYGFCFHPGSAGSSDPAGAIERIAEAITHALEHVPGTSRVLIENTAGAGRTMGRTAEEIAAMLRQVPTGLRSRAGYGLDTCHLFASGHEITKPPQAVVEVLDRFVETIGEPPSFFHLNDSDGEMGSNRDRHALIGEGRIGIETFRTLLADPRTHDIPLILETPQKLAEPADDDDTPDEYDVRMIRLLEGLTN
jgi:deoxyribonuclease IV